MSTVTFDLFLVIFAGLFGGLTARLFKQPLVLGYILAGIIVGPYTGGATVTSVDHIADLADIGAALLLFSLGLEFSARDLKPIGRIALFGSTIQVVITFLAVTLIGYLLGWPLIPSFWFATAVASSSTALILKTLSDKGLRQTLSGKVMLGVSIVQDIQVIPLMILLGSLSTEGFALLAVLKPILSTVVFVLLIALFATRILPWALHHVARLNSDELFMLSVVSTAFGIGYISYLFGLSLAFGAFIAGLVLKESDYGSKALSGLAPLRDLFGLLFFASIGMLFDPNFVFANLSMIIALVVATTGIKGIILALVGRGFGYRRIVPLAMFFGMIPISEIAFIVVRTAINLGAITQQNYLVILNVVILSMIAGPVLAGFSGPAYGLVRKYRNDTGMNTINIPESGMNSHHIITGGSDVGVFLAESFQALKLPFVVIEPYYQSFCNLAGRGFQLIFGEPDREAILGTARIERARTLIITESELVASETVIEQALKLNPAIRIILLTNSLDRTEASNGNPQIRTILLERQVADDLARTIAESETDSQS